ncbi:hypothetical protein D3C76_1700850 [compost metagenome]
MILAAFSSTTISASSISPSASATVSMKFSTVAASSTLWARSFSSFSAFWRMMRGPPSLKSALARSMVLLSSAPKPFKAAELLISFSIFSSSSFSMSPSAEAT